MSIHEEAFNSAQNPMMAVFNNLVLFKQDVPQNRIDTIEPAYFYERRSCQYLGMLS